MGTRATWMLSWTSRSNEACTSSKTRARRTGLATVGNRWEALVTRGRSFSFYPTKNLGALGDGGFIATDDKKLAAHLKRLRNGGQSSRDVHESIGFNSRLDELQAAVLRAKLPRLERGNDRRREIAKRYVGALEGTELVPVAVLEIAVSARHLFVVKARSRDALEGHLGPNVGSRRSCTTPSRFICNLPIVAWNNVREAVRLPRRRRRASSRCHSIPPCWMTDEDVDCVVQALRALRASP